MILGSKPLSEMSNEEMLAAIEELRSKREALRAEAIAKKQKNAETAVKERKPRTPKASPMDDILRAAMEENEKDD